MNPTAAEKLGLAPYDSADYLHDEEDITAYLQAVMAEDSEDPGLLGPRPQHEPIGPRHRPHA